MRNMIIAIATLAALIFVGNAMAAAPISHETPSVLVESASDVPSAIAAQPVADKQTMVNNQMEAPIVYDGPIVQSEPQPIQYHQGHHHVYHRAPAKKQNAFEKLMELERKKNAWLKKTFLGR